VPSLIDLAIDEITSSYRIGGAGDGDIPEVVIVPSTSAFIKARVILCIEGSSTFSRRRRTLDSS